MNKKFKEYLFTKRVLVGGDMIHQDENNKNNDFNVLYSLYELFGIKLTSIKGALDSSMITLAEQMLGIRVPAPFYKNYPTSVKRLSKNELLFDQISHYFNTYGLGNFEGESHSLFESVVVRSVFSEKMDIKEFRVLDEVLATKELNKYVSDMTKGTRPLSDTEYSIFLEYIDEFGVEDAWAFASKNLVVRLLVDTKNITYFCRYLALPDVIKIVDYINYVHYKNKNLKKLNLSNVHRKFIKSILDELFERDCSSYYSECFEKRKIWCGLLHHIHYVASNERAKSFLELVRGSKINYSGYSEFEKEMLRGDIGAAIRALDRCKGITSVLRNMDYIISRCKNTEQINDLFEYIYNHCDNGLVLMQLLMHYHNYMVNGPRTFTFTRHNMMTQHIETESEVGKRKSSLSSNVVRKCSSQVTELVKRHYSGKLANERIYIDDEFFNIALPLSENASFGGVGTMTKGSRMPFKVGKKIRAFVYWEQVDDIDLSVIGLQSNGDVKEYSWRTMFRNQSTEICYSGDVTDGRRGGSEYFDVDIEMFNKKHPLTRYLIFCANVFSNATFDAVTCRAGYMSRDILDNGEVYEPKTVETSFQIDCHSRMAQLFALDLRTAELIWLNLPISSSASVAASGPVRIAERYFDVLGVLNLGMFASWMASDNVVFHPEEADVIFSDKTFENVGSNVKYIRSYDTEAIRAFMNI